MIDEKCYTDFITVFESPEDRTIEKLAKVYEKKDFLVEVILKLFSNREFEQKIKDKRILLKPNWVLHNRKPSDELCLRTHDNFLLAALEAVLKLSPKSVLIADAPVQGAKWDKVVRKDLLENIDSLRNYYNVPLIIKDFRRVTFDPQANNITIEKNPISDYVIFDLGKRSYLEPITSDKPLFRVTDYDPDRLAESHAPGMHKYCVAKEVFEADVVITLPKAKTHQKAGLTNALKILVGINGDKDFLPHHRKGGTAENGDCYPGRNFLLRLSESVIDMANKHRGQRIYKPLRYSSIMLWKLSFPSPRHNLAAAWHGNDTTWRMTLDLNHIAEFGKSDGSLANVRQRELFSLSDGIIGGQGDGPLKPEPLPLGIVCFSNCSSLTDAAIAVLMGFDLEKIALVREALLRDNDKIKELTLNGFTLQLDDLKYLAIKTTPPPGWVDYLA